MNIELRDWLNENHRQIAKNPIRDADDQRLQSWQLVLDWRGIVEIPSLYSVTGRPVTFKLSDAAMTAKKAQSVVDQHLDEARSAIMAGRSRASVWIEIGKASGANEVAFALDVFNTQQYMENHDSIIYAMEREP